jgi:hypothetical protein
MYNIIFLVLYSSEIWARATKYIPCLLIGESNLKDIFFTICYNGKPIKEDYIRRICKTRLKDKMHYSGICGQEGKGNLFLRKCTGEKWTGVA